MNTTFTLIGSYNWVLVLIYELKIDHRLSIGNEPEITNHKPVTDNSVILNAVNALLSSAGFNKDELNIALDLIKNAINSYIDELVRTRVVSNV